MMEVDYTVSTDPATGYAPSPQSLELIKAMQEFTLASDAYVHHVSGNNKMAQRDMYALRAIMQSSMVGKSLTPTELAKAVNLSMPATTALIDRLVKSGHITRQPSETDRRRIVLTATEKATVDGRRMFMPLAQALMQVIDQYSPEQIQLMTDFMAKSAQAVEASSATSTPSR